MGTSDKEGLCIPTSSMNHQMIQPPRWTPGTYNSHMTFCHKAQVSHRGCDMTLLSHKPLQGDSPETWAQGVSRSLWQPLQHESLVWGPGPSTDTLGLGEATLPAGAEGLLRLYCVLLWLEAEVLDVLPKPLIEPLLYTGGQPLAAALCGKEQRHQRGELQGPHSSF